MTSSAPFAEPTPVTTPGAVAKRLAERGLRASISLHRHLTRRLPLPLSYWVAMGNLCQHLRPNAHLLVPQGIDLSHRHLGTGFAAQVLANVPLSPWTLDPAVIAFLEANLLRRQPATIVECGSGASTLVLAAYCAQHTHLSAHVFSLEQDETHAARTNELLETLDLSRFVTLCYAPLAPILFSGFHILSYQVHQTPLISALGARAADFLLIDGPAGPDATRIAVLHQLRPLLSPHTYWMMDDALRWGELQILSTWTRLDMVCDVRIHQTGRGIADGMISPSFIPRTYAPRSLPTPD